MKITVCRQPSILHEATELVHAFVNQTPVEQLVGQGTLGISEEEFLRIRDTACEGLDPDDEEIQFFFRGIPFEDTREGLFSIARNMVYAWADEIHGNAGEMADFLLRYWRRYKGTLRVKGVHLCGVCVSPDEQGRFNNLTKEISRLPLSPTHQMQLVETMSNYEFYLQRLLNILRPVFEKLPALLLPWMHRVVPLLQRWEQFFSHEGNFRQFFLERSAVDSELPQEMRLYPRAFWAHISYVFPADSYRILNIHLSMNREPELHDSPKEKIELENRDIQVLRQLASADRMAMLMAMMESPMTAMEVARKLDLHPSSVFRDIGSMGNSHLLIQEIKGGKSTYRTNYALLEKLFRKILRMLETAGGQRPEGELPQSGKRSCPGAPTPRA